MHLKVPYNFMWQGKGRAVTNVSWTCGPTLLLISVHCCWFVLYIWNMAINMFKLGDTWNQTLITARGCSTVDPDNPAAWGCTPGESGEATARPCYLGEQDTAATQAHRSGEPVTTAAQARSKASQTLQTHVDTQHINLDEAIFFQGINQNVCWEVGLRFKCWLIFQQC